MNRNDDFDQTLAAWLRREAPPQAPDQVLDAALERVARESQRRSWLHRLQGKTHMATLIRAAAVAAVVAIALLVGLQFGNLVPDIGASSPSPSEVVRSSSSGTPSAVPTASLPAGCVNPPTDITTLIDLQSTGPLDPAGDPVACYGNAPLTFDATWSGGGVADCPAAPEPAWLACSASSLRAVGDTRKLGAPQVGDTPSAPELWVAVDPSVTFSPPEPFAQVRVTGHFDDPAAQICRDLGSMPGESPRPAAEVIESCRRTFVVTQVMPLQPPECVNPPPDIVALRDQVAYGDPVACYGNTPLTLDAYLTGPVIADCVPSFEPAWLGCPSAGTLMLVGETRKLGAPRVFVDFDPATGVSFDAYIGTNVRITGHFDDPAAQSCREVARGFGETPAPAAAIESCRRTFVVTHVMPL